MKFDLLPEKKRLGTPCLGQEEVVVLVTELYAGLRDGRTDGHGRFVNTYYFPMLIYEYLS